MIEVLISLICLGLIWIFYVGYGLFSNRMDEKQKELDEFSGVLDVKREAKDKLNNDPDHVKRVQNEFNDS